MKHRPDHTRILGGRVQCSGYTADMILHILALVLLAASTGRLAGAAARHLDRRRGGGTLIFDALASGGISLLFAPKDADAEQLRPH
jgi:hypothetical protein